MQAGKKNTHGTLEVPSIQSMGLKCGVSSGQKVKDRGSLQGLLKRKTAKLWYKQQVVWCRVWVASKSPV